MSQDALSKILPTSRKTIVNWESDISAPDARQLGVLFANGFDINYIVTGIRIDVGDENIDRRYMPNEVKRIIEAFYNTDNTGRDALMAIVNLIKQKTDQ